MSNVKVFTCHARAVPRRPGEVVRVLAAALDEAGIDRKTVYVTNAVEHVEFERGAKNKRRIHTKPIDTGICGCHSWLEEEIKVNSELAEIEIAK